jgi:RNA polymerase sigma-70 factor (ECF subfamily)
VGFEETALPYLESVACFALSLTRSRADADDLVQETFLRAFKGWHTFMPGTDCRRWLFTICRHAFIKLNSRKSANFEVLEGDLDAMPAVLGHAEAVRCGLGDLFDQIDVGPAIRAAIDALPEPHHSIVALVDLEGLSYEEAAAVLEIPVGTVRSRLYRARRHVQDVLLDHARDMGIATDVVPECCTPATAAPCAR